MEKTIKEPTAISSKYEQSNNNPPTTKIFLLSMLVFFLYLGGTVLAQEGTLTSRKGEHFLPDSSDWAIGIDAVPVMNYIGNLFGKTTVNNSPTWGYPNAPLAITAKYFKNAHTAYRIMARIGISKVTLNNYVVKDDQTGAIDPSVTVTDEFKRFQGNVLLGGGIEKRKGKTRLQGYYGWMGMIYIGTKKDTYTYGNNYSSTNITPTSTDWSKDSSVAAVSRTTLQKYGTTWGLDIRGFVGAEYFIFPKMAIGAEFGWGLAASTSTDGVRTTAYWDQVGNKLNLSDKRTGGITIWGLDTDVNGVLMMPTGSLMLTLHF